MTQATGSSFFTQAMALATANTTSTALPELLAFMTSRLGQQRANTLVQKVGHLLTLEQQYTLQETYLYGSSRLGVKNQQLTLSTRVASVQNGSLTPIGNAILNTDSVFTGTAAVYGLPKAPSAKIFNRTWGLKQYELSNHLGNVQVTISDKKIGITNSGSTDFIAYEPEVKSATDYYAYGMEMPGKTYQSTAYRYGMNTQEKDNEIYGSGNTLGALYWEYDARIARRWNVDPVVKEYEGAYTTFSGNPIWFVDIEGNDSTVYLASFSEVALPNGQTTYENTLSEKDVNKVGEYLKQIYAKNGIKIKYQYVSVEQLAKLKLDKSDAYVNIKNSFALPNITIFDDNGKADFYETQVDMARYNNRSGDKFYMTAYAAAHEVLHQYITAAAKFFKLPDQPQHEITPVPNLNSAGDNDRNEPYRLSPNDIPSTPQKNIQRAERILDCTKTMVIQFIRLSRGQ